MAIAPSGDVAIIIDLARLVAPGRQAQAQPREKQFFQRRLDRDRMFGNGAVLFTLAIESHCRRSITM